MWTIVIPAPAEATVLSHFFANHRHLPSHAKVRSTPSDGRQNLEAFGLVSPLDDLESERSNLSQCALQLRAGITTVSEDMSQPRPAPENGLEDGRRAVAILNIGAVNHEADHQSNCIDDNMTLASVDLLARVIARNSAAFRGFQALTIDHTAEGEALRPSSSRAAITI